MNPKWKITFQNGSIVQAVIVRGYDVNDALSSASSHGAYSSNVVKVEKVFEADAADTIDASIN